MFSHSVDPRQQDNPIVLLPFSPTPRPTFAPSPARRRIAATWDAVHPARSRTRGRTGRGRWRAVTGQHPSSTGLRATQCHQHRAFPDRGGKNLPLTEVEWTVARAGLEDITSHILHRTRATHVSMNDITPAQVAHVLGNPRSGTEKTCAKCQPGCLRAAVNAACGGRRVDEGAEERV
jgi:hypothetical protein